MAYRKRVQEGLYGDTKEDIDACLNCKRPKCNNCLDSASIVRPNIDWDDLSENEKKYEVILSDTERKLLDFYCTRSNDSDIARGLGVASSTVRNMRLRMHLPVVHKNTYADRCKLVAPWRRPSDLRT